MAKSKQSEIDIDNVSEDIGNVIESDEGDMSLHMEKLEREKDEYKALYLRALADYKNLENRTNNERERTKEHLKKQMIESLLPVLDNMDQAEVFLSDPGLKMVSDSFRKALLELGVREIELLGNEYDPETAEVVEVVEGKQDDIIVEVLQKGYAMNGTVIRHGRVKVSKKH